MRRRSREAHSCADIIHVVVGVKFLETAFVLEAGGGVLDAMMVPVLALNFVCTHALSRVGLCKLTNFMRGSLKH